MRFSAQVGLVALLLGLTQPSIAPAQTGILITAHGAGPEWNARIRELAAKVQWRFGPVATAFLMGPEAESAGWQAGVDSLVARGAKEIVAVPLMVSTHGGHVRQIEFYAGLVDSLPARLKSHTHGGSTGKPPVPVRVTPALDAAPELGLALAERWRELTDADRRRPVVLVAHGPESADEARLWVLNLTAAGSVLAAAGHTGEVRVGLLKDDAPAAVRAAAVAELRDTVSALARMSQDSVVVLPVLMSAGPLVSTKVPGDLAALPIRYHPVPLAPATTLARWIERMGEEHRLGLTSLSAAERGRR